MTAPAIERLSRDPAFQALLASGHRRRLPRDHKVLGEGETPRTLYFILSGSVAVRLSNWHGQEVLLAYMHPGDFFGEMGLFPDVKARSAMIQTLTDCLVLEVGYETFVTLSTKHPALWLELAGQLAARLRSTNRRLADMPAVPAVERIWSVILELAERAAQPMNGEPVSLRITRTDLGKLAGCSRELAGSVLHELAQQKRLELRGHQIVVPRNARGP